MDLRKKVRRTTKTKIEITDYHDNAFTILFDVGQGTFCVQMKQIDLERFRDHINLKLKEHENYKIKYLSSKGEKDD